METIEAIEKLQKLYQEKLIIPSVKRKHKIMLCPIGYIAAGKTTVMKPLSEKLGLVRLSTDELRVLAREEGIPCHEYAVTLNLIRYYLSKGYSIACDFNCASVEMKADIEIESTNGGAETIFIKIDPPKEWIMEKVKNMTYTKEGLFKDKEVGISEVERSFREHQLPELNYAHVFDTSSSNLKDEIDIFAFKLKET